MNSLERNTNQWHHKPPVPGVKRTIRNIAWSVALWLMVTGCNPSKTESTQTPWSEAINISYPGTISIKDTDSLELKQAKSEFNIRIAQLNEKYWMNAKIYEPKDIPELARCNIEGYSITKYIYPDDLVSIHAMIAYLDVILEGVQLYNKEMLKELRNIYFIWDMYRITNDPSLWYPEYMEPDGFGWWSRIWLKLTPQNKERYKEVFHHEFTHVIHHNLWPFDRASGTTVHYDGTARSQHPWFSSRYGMTNSREDAATVWESIMSAVLKFEWKKVNLDQSMSIPSNDSTSVMPNGTLPIKTEIKFHDTEDNIFSRIKEDSVLARKVMYMTGSYYDTSQWKFIWDFSPLEFRHYFHVPKGQEFPFYARMKTKGKYDHEYWNKILGFDGSRK